MTPYEITHKHSMKYNTVRSIVNSFKTNHRINIKKKLSGYTKKPREVFAELAFKDLVENDKMKQLPDDSKIRNC